MRELCISPRGSWILSTYFSPKLASISHDIGPAGPELEGLRQTENSKKLKQEGIRAYISSSFSH